MAACCSSFVNYLHFAYFEVFEQSSSLITLVFYTIFHCGLDSVLPEGFFLGYFFIFLPPVTMSNHSKDRVVYKWEQLIEISRSQMIPRLRSQIPHELKKRRCESRAVAKRRERKRKFKPALPSIIMGSVRSLANKLEVLTRANVEFWKCSLMCFTEV